MKVECLPIADVKLISPKKFSDGRGFFSETWNERALEAAGLQVRFVQDNHAYSKPAGTVRGLHFQLPPLAQDKLIRVTRGAIMDVAVDIRRSSPTFGQYVSAVLSAENWQQLWVPKGFAHGYCTLEPETEVIYKVTGYYSPAHDRGIMWDDPGIGIDWPVARDAAHVSGKDKMQPALGDATQLFD